MAIIQNTTPFYVSAEANVYIAFLDGKYLQDKEQVYTALEKALQLPDYFGKNLDALDELLHELDWIEQSHVLLIIHRRILLLQHDIEFKDELIQLFNENNNTRLQIIFR